MVADESNNNGLRKKICSGQMRHFGPKNGTSSKLWIGSKNFFEICAMNGVNSAWKLY